jgi:hypothetical protein
MFRGRASKVRYACTACFIITGLSKVQAAALTVTDVVRTAAIVPAIEKSALNSQAVDSTKVMHIRLL